MANYCKLLYYFLAITLSQSDIEANSTITTTPLLTGSTINSSASITTTLSTSDTPKSPSSLVITPTKSTATDNSPSKSSSTPLSETASTSDTVIVSLNKSFTTSSTSDSSDTFTPTSITLSSMSEPTSIFTSESITITIATSDTMDISSSLSISKTSLTSVTMNPSLSEAITKTSTMSGTTAILASSSNTTTLLTSAQTTISPSTAITTASTSQTGIISHSTSITSTAPSSGTMHSSPSNSAALTSFEVQPTTSLSAASTTSSTLVQTSISPSASATATTSKLESTAMSSSTSGTTTARSELTTTSKKIFTVDLEGLNVDLQFSIKMNQTFKDAYKNKGSSEFKELAKVFAEALTEVYKNTSGFKYIEVREFRSGSVEADYSVIISASVNLTQVKEYITVTLFYGLKSLTINDSKVDEDFLNRTMKIFSAASNSKCDISTQRLCPFGYICEEQGQMSVRCSAKCNNHTCVYGSCYADYEDESIMKCRCPTDDDGYVYSGERCQHKSLSTLIIIISAVGGGVLVAAFFIICVICIKMKRNREKSDDIQLDSLPDYSKYFPRDSNYQPKNGHDLDGKSNMTYMYEDLDKHFGDNNSELNRERHTYDYIERDKKFEIRRPQFR